eukprot:s1830_g16.t1
MERDRPVMQETLATRDCDDGFTGKKELLVESEMYTFAFSEALAKIVAATALGLADYIGKLDHSQGRWFAPGEALPPGFIVCAHPEGHRAPQEGHLMSNKATEASAAAPSAAEDLTPWWCGFISTCFSASLSRFILLLHSFFFMLLVFEDKSKVGTEQLLPSRVVALQLVGSRKQSKLAERHLLLP